MVDQSAQWNPMWQDDHHPHQASFGLAGTGPGTGFRKCPMPSRIAEPIEISRHEEMTAQACPVSETHPHSSSPVKRHGAVGHWLHTDHSSQELNLTDLLDLTGPASEQLLSMVARVVQATQDTVRPYSFIVSPTDLGVRIEGDAVAVMIASQVIERSCHGHAGWMTDAGTTESLIADVVANVLKCDLSLVLNGLPKYVTLQSVAQAAYLQTLLGSNSQLVLGIGPTGTGKTHLAIVAALNHLADERVHRIVLTRPHVVGEGEVVTAATRQELEADNQLDYFDDILFELLGHEKVAKMKQDLKLEVIPLGRMRGRTFNNAFIVLDEAQNTSIAKMRMAVTRIGAGTRMVLTGDPSHVELLGGEQSGLVDLIDLLNGSEIAKIHRFDNKHIVHNDIVARLDKLYASRQDFIQS